MTAREICTSALSKIGIIGEGETPGSDALALAFSILNELNDTWRAEGVLGPVMARTEYTLTANTGSYTVGPTGTLVGPRPFDLIDARVKASATAGEMPIDVLSPSQFAAKPYKDETMAVPTWLYLEPTPGPNATLTIQTPTTPARLVLYVEQQLASFATLDTDYDLKEGYERAYKTNLAVTLADADFARPISEGLRGSAENAYLRLVNRKQSEDVPEMDPTGNYPSGVGGFDIVMGDYS